MKESDWEERGYGKFLLGPGMCAWHKDKGSEESFMLVTGTGQHENELPPESGPFLVCRYQGDPYEGAAECVTAATVAELLTVLADYEAKL